MTGRVQQASDGLLPAIIDNVCNEQELEQEASYPAPHFRDRQMMRRALQAARQAYARGEVPVGAVVALGDEMLAVAANEREASQDPTAHAELLALRRAADKIGSWRLSGCTLYSTLEPCPMCAGAAHAARISRLVYAAPDPKAGYAGTLHNIPTDSRLNHTFPSESGVLGEEAANLLRDFFKERRKTARIRPRTSPEHDETRL
ncbi:MAG: nucleoside deaminase [Rubrobacteraceae bacterium]